MILVEGLFGDWWTELPSSNPETRTSRAYHPHRRRRLDFVHVTRHQFDVRVAKRPATFIVQCYPAHELQPTPFWRRDCVVTVLPVHTARHVPELRRRSARLVRLQLPSKRRIEHRVVGHRRGKRLARKP